MQVFILLRLINLTENYTQKFIAKQMFLSKQTINSGITAFGKQGIVGLHELPEDRRQKIWI